MKQAAHDFQKYQILFRNLNLRLMDVCERWMFQNYKHISLFQTVHMWTFYQRLYVSVCMLFCCRASPTNTDSSALSDVVVLMSDCQRIGFNDHIKLYSRPFLQLRAESLIFSRRCQKTATSLSEWENLLWASECCSSFRREMILSLF